MIEGYEVSDAHVHYGECSLLGAKVRCLDLLAHVKRNGLTTALVTPLDVDVPLYNHQLYENLALAPRLHGLARIQLRRDIEDVKTLIQIGEKMVGAKFHPSFDRVPVTNGAYESLFTWLEEHRFLALIHCGRWREVSNYGFALEVAEAHPGLKVILAHMGGNELALSMGAIEAARGLTNVYFDTSNCRIPHVIETAVELLGDERILLGSDYPWGSLMANAWTVLDSEIPEDAKRRILSLNLEELLEGLR